MLVTVPSAAAETVATTLSAAQELQINNVRESGKTKLTIQNLGGYDIYVEHGAAASVAGSVKIPATIGVMDFPVEVLTDLSWISATADNVNVRIITR